MGTVPEIWAHGIFAGGFKVRDQQDEKGYYARPPRLSESMI